MGIRVPINIESEAAGEAMEDARLRAIVRTAVRAALRDRGHAEAEISVTLLDDEGIRELNREYLERDRVTDVIAFSLFEKGEDPLGDVYIGFEQALRQAKTLKVDPEEELTRLSVHATLHVLGFDHPETDARDRSEMWQMQERIVAAIMAA
jgi:probable rRNA maturation factor